jgi:hypothetical protein
MVDCSTQSSLKSTVDNWREMFEVCLSKGSEIQCLVNRDELLEKVPRMDDGVVSISLNFKLVSFNFVKSSIALLDFFTPYTALSIVTTCSHFLWWTVN